MKVKIAENIRTLRKQHSFTQEQLSEALGVTVSAVYKWESGQSVPEVKMLMELADLFEVSVDTLLGYDRQNENVENRIKRINQCMKEMDLEEAVLEAEKTLKKYPNNFDVVNVAAAVYRDVFFEKKDKKAMQKSIDLYYNAISLLYQNKESSINESTLLTIIGCMYMEAGEEEKGLELLKKNNASGVNNVPIGLNLAMMGRWEEAKEFLFWAYFFNVRDTPALLRGMMYMYGGQKNELYKEVGQWLLHYFDSLVADPEAVTLVTEQKAFVLTDMALIAADLGNYIESEQYLKDAYLLARKFDANPNYDMRVLKLWQDWDMLTMYIGGQDVSAASAMEIELIGKAKQGPALDFVKSKFEELKREGITE